MAQEMEKFYKLPFFPGRQPIFSFTRNLCNILQETDTINLPYIRPGKEREIYSLHVRHSNYINSIDRSYGVSEKHTERRNAMDLLIISPGPSDPDPGDR